MHFLITNKYLLKLFTNIIIRNIVTATMLEGYDMNILKDYVFRLYPDKNREELINKTFGCIKKNIKKQIRIKVHMIKLKYALIIIPQLI